MIIINEYNKNESLANFRQALLINIYIIFTNYVTYIMLLHLMVEYSWKGGGELG
jgi:hypothetical protein